MIPFLFLLLAVPLGEAAPSAPRRLLMLEPALDDGIAAEEGAAVGGALNKALGNIPCAQRAKKVEGPAAERYVCASEPSCARTLGESAGANLLVLSLVSTGAQGPLLSLTLVDARSGALVAESSGPLATPPTLEPLLRLLFPELAAEERLAALRDPPALREALAIFYAARARVAAAAGTPETAAHQEYVRLYEESLARDTHLTQQMAILLSALRQDAPAAACLVTPAALSALEQECAALQHEKQKLIDIQKRYKREWVRRPFVAPDQATDRPGYFDFSQPQPAPVVPDDPVLRAIQKSGAAATPTPAIEEQNITRSVLEHGADVYACMDQAQRHTGALQGEVLLLLSFAVMPDGSLQAARVAVPATLAKTKVASCLANAMKGWRMKAGSAVGVLNLPLSYGAEGSRRALLIEH